MNMNLEGLERFEKNRCHYFHDLAAETNFGHFCWLKKDGMRPMVKVSDDTRSRLQRKYCPLHLCENASFFAVIISIVREFPFAENRV